VLRAASKPQYDFIVCGSGSSGSVVAHRFAEEGNVSMLLLEAGGDETDERGNGVVTEPRMYQLIAQPQFNSNRKFEIEFLDPGVQAFSFTLG
jgi:choline dehydrogenase-like flavoprotein